MIEFENMIVDLGNITTVQRVISRSRSYQRCAHGWKGCYVIYIFVMKSLCTNFAFDKETLFVT